MTRVCIEQGELEGTLEDLPSGQKYSSFKGIPYAEPPVGDLRFKAPRPAGKWIGIRDASNHGKPCPQVDMRTDQVIDGSEDCLSLNVYTTDINGNPAPVMVWFHGGAFRSGSADSIIYGPEYLLEEGVVVVTVNYRLEVLGFLSLETENVPGNAGMKDQVLALKWVQENIKKFGGDPDNVTIFGESAGAAAVTYHLVSPMSKGLFHRMISQSGCFLNDWAYSEDTLERGFRLGRFLGCNTEDVEELTNFLKSTPTSKLINVTPHIVNERDDLNTLPLYFCPSVEKSFPGQESFLPKQPIDLLLEGNFNKVPVLIGYTRAEAALFLQDFFKKSSRVQDDFTSKIPKDIIIQTRPSNNILKYLADEIKKFYYGDKLIGQDTVIESCDLESDFMFNYGILRFTEILAKESPFPVYLYRFSSDGELNFCKEMSGYSQIKGAVHGDDLFYLFKNWMQIDVGSDEWKTMKRMTKMWTNFATYGDPTPLKNDLIPIKWPPVTPEKITYLEIDFNLRVASDPDKERYNFWNKIYDIALKSISIKSSL